MSYVAEYEKQYHIYHVFKRLCILVIYLETARRFFGDFFHLHLLQYVFEVCVPVQFFVSDIHEVRVDFCV